MQIPSSATYLVLLLLVPTLSFPTPQAELHLKPSSDAILPALTTFSAAHHLQRDLHHQLTTHAPLRAPLITTARRGANSDRQMLWIDCEENSTERCELDASSRSVGGAPQQEDESSSGFAEIAIFALNYATQISQHTLPLANICTAGLRGPP